MKVSKLLKKKSVEEVTMMVDKGSPAETGTQQGGAAPGVRAPKSSEFRE